jgi:hypothetical protein
VFITRQAGEGDHEVVEGALLVAGRISQQRAGSNAPSTPPPVLCPPSPIHMGEEL